MEENAFYSPAVLTFHFSVRVHSLLPSSLCTLGLDLVVMSQTPQSKRVDAGAGVTARSARLDLLQDGRQGCGKSLA